jgi:hypothetical protein
VLNASFGEVGLRCLPIPTKNAPVENYIDWFEKKVKAVSGVVWQLNNNFVVLAIEGVLNMLHSSVIENVPGEVQKIDGHPVWRWWKNHGLLEALRRLEGSNAETVSFANT